MHKTAKRVSAKTKRCKSLKSIGFDEKTVNSNL